MDKHLNYPDHDLYHELCSGAKDAMGKRWDTLLSCLRLVFRLAVI